MEEEVKRRPSLSIASSSSKKFTFWFGTRLSEVIPFQGVKLSVDRTESVN